MRDDALLLELQYSAGGGAGVKLSYYNKSLLPAMPGRPTMQPSKNTEYVVQEFNASYNALVKHINGYLPILPITALS